MSLPPSTPTAAAAAAPPRAGGPAAPTTTPSSPTQSRLLARFPALHRLHLLNPSVPLPTLALSFGLLHELTAVVPVVGLFYAFRQFGGGRAVVDQMAALEHTVAGAESRVVEGWLDEGERKIERVGRRYGLLGFPKTVKGAAAAGGGQETAAARADNDRRLVGRPLTGKDLAGDVANAVGAYMVVKVR